MGNLLKYSSTDAAPLDKDKLTGSRSPDLVYSYTRKYIATVIIVNAIDILLLLLKFLLAFVIKSVQKRFYFILKFYHITVVETALPGARRLLVLTVDESKVSGAKTMIR